MVDEEAGGGTERRRGEEAGGGALPDEREASPEAHEHKVDLSRGGGGGDLAEADDVSVATGFRAVYIGLCLFVFLCGMGE